MESLSPRRVNPSHAFEMARHMALGDEVGEGCL
jgi:hypothetical protein